jgi:hypothetical protein
MESLLIIAQSLLSLSIEISKSFLDSASNIPLIVSVIKPQRKFFTKKIHKNEAANIGIHFAILVFSCLSDYSDHEYILHFFFETNLYNLIQKDLFLLIYEILKNLG